jgi:hypothetical protein
MEANKIIEGNRLIAKFMNSFENPRDKDWMIYNPGGNPRKKDDALYHKSWDWLMPVVLKIFDLKVVVAYEITEIQNLKDKLDDALLYLSCELLWKRVVEFIKWYNAKQNIT